MDRFEIVGSRTDSRNLYVDISYQESVREAKALDAALAEILAVTRAKQTRGSNDDSQRYAFSNLLTHMLRFSDEGHFRKTAPDRAKKIRTFGQSVIAQMTAILEEHRQRKVVTVSFNQPEAPEVLLKTIQKMLRKASR